MPNSRVNLVHGLRLFIKRCYQLLRRGIYTFGRKIGGESFRFGGPRRLFSIWDDPGNILVVQPDQAIRPAPLDSLRIKSGLNQQHRAPWPIFWKRIPEARLVGKSLAVLNSKKELMLEDVCGEGFYRDDPSYNYLFLPKPVRLQGAWTSLIDRWCASGTANYYHWMLDGLPRLALIDRFPSDIRILVPSPLRPFQIDSLKMLGLGERCRPTPETHLLIEDYYFSSPAMITGCDNPYAIHFLRDRFLQPEPPANPSFEKIYITRRGAARRPYREEEMIAILQEQGWAIIQAENYNLKEQIALFWNARAICAAHGAGLTNLLWCRKGCRVLELAPSTFLNGCFEGLAAYLDLDYRYLIFDADPKCRMKINLKAFAAAIKDLA